MVIAVVEVRIDYMCIFSKRQGIMTAVMVTIFCIYGMDVGSIGSGNPRLWCIKYLNESAPKLFDCLVENRIKERCFPLIVDSYGGLS